MGRLECVNGGCRRKAEEPQASNKPAVISPTDSMTETQVSETMDRILQEQQAHSEALSHMMQEYNAAAPGPQEGPSPSAPYSGLHITSEVMMEASRQYGILGE